MPRATAGWPTTKAGAGRAAGTVDAGLLRQLLASPTSHRPPPKSTGRDLFNAGWLDANWHAPARRRQADVQATLAELTARAAADALTQHLPDARRLIVCGGGALNGHLMARLAALLPSVQVATSDEHGLPPQQVEVGGLRLAGARVRAAPFGNRPEVTGAAGPRLLGCLYPAH